MKYILIFALGLFSSVAARSINRDHGRIKELLPLDLYSLLESDVVTTWRVNSDEKAFEFHKNATGTFNNTNMAGNFSERGFSDFHMNLETHSGRFHGMAFTEGRVANFTYYEVTLKEGEILGKGTTTDVMERSMTHVFLKTKDNSFTRISNSTLGAFIRLNSTKDGSFTYESFCVGHQNTSNNLMKWEDRVNGTIKNGKDGMRWRFSGRGAVDPMNATRVDPAFVNLLKIIPSENSGALGNFTDSSSGMIKIGAGVMPYETCYNQTVSSPNGAYENYLRLSGFQWQKSGPASPVEEGEYALHLMDIVNLIM